VEYASSTLASRTAYRVLRPLYVLLQAALLSIPVVACSSVPKATPPPTTVGGLIATSRASPTVQPPTSTPRATLTPIGQVSEPELTSSPVSRLTAGATDSQAGPVTPEIDDTPQPTVDPSRINPLTGLEVADPSVLERQPVAVKVSNFPAVVRPQAGLGSADVVVEHEAEVRITRFTAVFYGDGAEKVGPVRSARLIDLEIPAMFRSFFAFSGASPGVVQRLKASDFSDRILSPDPNWSTEGFRRVPEPGRAYEHTLYTDTSTLWVIADSNGWVRRKKLEVWLFAPDPPGGGQSATQIALTYHPRYSSAEYSYDSDVEAYRRSVFGEPHTDELTGKQLLVDNVVVVYANHVLTDIVEDITGPQPLYSVEIQLWGGGRMQLFRNGWMYEGQWQRAKRDDLVRFLDPAGDPIPLKPGRTWIQLVRTDFEIERR
jgi:hypothetical protein